MNESLFLTVKQKLANSFVIFTAIWSIRHYACCSSLCKMLDNKELPSLGSDQIINEDNTERLTAEHTKQSEPSFHKRNDEGSVWMAQDYAK